MRHVLRAAVAYRALLAAIFQVGDGRGVREHADILVVVVRVVEQVAELRRATGEGVDAPDGEDHFLAVDFLGTVLHAVDFHQRLDDLEPKRLRKPVDLFLDVFHILLFFR